MKPGNEFHWNIERVHTGADHLRTDESGGKRSEQPGGPEDKDGSILCQSLGRANDVLERGKSHAAEMVGTPSDNATKGEQDLSGSAS